MHPLDIYSDKGNLGTLFSSRSDAQQFMTDWLRDCFSSGGDPNDMPKLLEIKKKIGGQTFRFWLVAFAYAS